MFGKRNEQSVENTPKQQFNPSFGTVDAMDDIVELSEDYSFTSTQADSLKQPYKKSPSSISSSLLSESIGSSTSAFGEKETATPSFSFNKPSETVSDETTEFSLTSNQQKYSPEVKQEVLDTLIGTVNLSELSNLDEASARDEVKDVVNEIVNLRKLQISMAAQEALIEDICDDIFGLGALEPLLARDDIADIMVNGAGTTFIEVDGKVQRTPIIFQNNEQLMNICQRIVSQVGRRVDESSPICDARLLDGSRVNVIAPPLAVDGPCLTIRKFKKDKLTLDELIRFGTISPEAAEVLKIIGKSQCNVLISGGTGSGKTTLLNCLTSSIGSSERIITCEDSAELQLQQPHVVRLETRPPNIEGTGEITMRDLVKNCLRMRPERIIVGEVRGAEAFDLLQAMNTGHDGSMGTLHANSPREALSRVESMITMGGFTLPAKTIREMIVASVDIVIQVQRLRDGSRRITHITEVTGLEEGQILLQDLVLYEMQGSSDDGKIYGTHVGTGVSRPSMWSRAEYFNEQHKLALALDKLNALQTRSF